MPKHVIVLPARREGEIAYIKGLAEEREVEIREKKYRYFVALGLDCEDRRGGRFASEFVADTVTTFYKFRALENLIKGYKSEQYDYYAYLGALLSVELEEEKKRISAIADGLYEIALESLVELRLGALSEGWAGLNELAAMLLRQCDSDEEVYSLIPYFMAGEALTPHLTVTGGGGLGLFSEGKRLTVPKLTGEPEKDVVLSLMRERPTHILIKNKDELSEPLLATLRALGE